MATNGSGSSVDSAHGSRVAFVTGGTSGIGRAVALGLAHGGDRVIFTGRDARRGAAVLAALWEANPAADHRFIPADLALLAETDRLAEAVSAATDRLDAIVFAGGFLSTIPEWTAEGLERTLVVNYLSRYLLARRLLALLKRAHSGRLVVVSDAGFGGDRLDFDDLQHRTGKPGFAVVARTQCANDMLVAELAERLRGTPVEVTGVFPGFVETGALANARGLPAALRLIVPRLVRRFGLTLEEAAETPLFLARAEAAVGLSGRFFGPRRKARPTPHRARRPGRRIRLWDAGEALIRPYLTEDDLDLRPDWTMPRELALHLAR